nr:MAG TPA: Atlastin [Bacteriophage sp.]DAU54617.1 MAG TPA: Atlastin [Caudoviricetes sp.]
MKISENKRLFLLGMLTWAYVRLTVEGGWK